MLLIFGAAACRGQDGSGRTVAFWNVENFFDTHHDTLKADSAFTPTGENHWTAKRYAVKRNNIYKVIAAMRQPAIVGLAEVENDRVLADLCGFTPLRKYGYRYIHFESPDRRGVDCALLYREGLFRIFEAMPIRVSDSAAGFCTRDILQVGGVLAEGGDSCFIFVNHWPSKLGGAAADRHRLEIAQRLLCTMDSVQEAHPGAIVLAVGDFNATADEKAVSQGLGFEGRCRNAQGFYSLTCGMPPGTGSYKYRDSWSCIDQAFANRELEAEIFAPEFMLIDDTRYMGKKLFRTYIGMRYQGGYSDHLPLIVRIR